jgi:hypothetical protein
VVVRAVGTPNIIEILELVLDGDVDAVEKGDFVGRAVEGALRAGAVIAVDVDDERVVGLPMSSMA